VKKIKLAILANIISIHTSRWVNALAERGYDICLITQDHGDHAISSSVKIYFLPFQGNKGYFLNALFLRRLLVKIKPDLLNAHYASGYGTLGRLSSFHPYILSVWGSDVYDFPYKSKFNMRLIQKNLKSADLIASTSKVMAEQVLLICKGIKKIRVTPFGVDTNIFKPNYLEKNGDIITVGTIKMLYHQYGIDTLISGFALARNSLMKYNTDIASKLRLLIVGGGDERERLEQLVDSNNISGVTIFTGEVPHSSVPSYLNRLDIYVAASRLESFGVAILEASACSLPVIVTNVGGLPEVVEDGVTGIIIEKENHHALAKAIEKLAIDKDSRIRMGVAGQRRVVEFFSWEQSVIIMEKLYRDVVSQFSPSVKV
jgi:glycosyltransferase involved in cell wall biosynthesis